jgi:hypothetical protein
MGASSVDSIEILQASPPSMRGESSAVSNNVYGIVGEQLMTNATGNEVLRPRGMPRRAAALTVNPLFCP